MVTEAGVAKTVVLHDDAGYLLAVVPATHRVELESIQRLLDRRLSLATEGEILDLAHDTVLVHVKASPEAIRERMKAEPREFGLLKEKDVEYILQRFEEEHKRSFLRQKIEIDNTDLTPEETLARFVEEIQPHLTEADRARILTRSLPA